MRYLHTMVRIHDLDASLIFYTNILGLVEIYRYDSDAGRYTNVFLAAPDDRERASDTRSPLLELTYNWPDEKGDTETYTGGRNFGHLAFAVLNIYETCTRIMEAGVPILRPPRDGKMAFIKSPDGISIELLQDGDPLPPAAPWDTMENTGSW